MDFTIDVTHNLHDIEKKVQKHNHRNGKLSAAAVIGIKNAVYECARFHIDAEQLSETIFY